MLLEAISHHPGTSNAYAVTDKVVEIRLKTGRDVDSVTITYGDKYAWQVTQKVLPMTIMGSDNLFYYWRALIDCSARRCRYCFRLTTGVDHIWLTEDGFKSVLSDNPDGFFDFPWIHLSDTLQIPDWVRDAVFYQIFPDRFANGDAHNDPPNLTPWRESPSPQSMYGGDLKGIIDRLPYLGDLGVNAIYLTPIFHAPSNHKYDTIDYFSVDPHFGDLETLQKLVRLCHERGIRVVLDAVFNHVGWDSLEFRDVRLHGADSPYAQWFHPHELPLQTHPLPNYDTFAFVASMPKLNTQNKEVREHLLQAAIFWIENADIDGWRLDVANGVDHAFWRELRHRVRAVKPSAYLLGEAMHRAELWLQGDQFDGVMNYPLTAALIAWLTDKCSATAFANRLVRIQFAYSRPALEGCLNLLDSHDTPRLLHQVGGNCQLLKLAVAAMFTLPGAPSIYYGDEVGMTGGADPDCRRGMVWAADKQNKALQNWYKRLITLRREERTLRRGDLEVLAWGEHVVGWWRRDDRGQSILTLINRGAAVVVLTNVLPAGEWVDLLSGDTYQAHQALPLLSALILKQKRSDEEAKGTEPFASRDKRQEARGKKRPAASLYEVQSAKYLSARRTSPPPRRTRA